MCRALIAEETAEREKEIEKIYKTINYRLETLENLLRSLIATSIQELKSEIIRLMEELEKKFNEHKTWTIEQINKMHEVLKNKQNLYLNFLIKIIRNLRIIKINKLLENI